MISISESNVSRGRLVREWTLEMLCVEKSDNRKRKGEGRESVRSINQMDSVGVFRLDRSRRKQKL